MKQFIIKSGLFVSPLLAALCIELFFLPIDFFTFRAWESLRVEGVTITPGKFYPDMTLTKEEVGRDAHHTPFAVSQKVTWITDKYGFRKQNTDRKIDIVLVGDSFIAGDGLDQNEMLSEQMETRLDRGVYPIAPATINDFLNMPRFCDDPPSVVVFQKWENKLERLRKPKLRLNKQANWRFRQSLSENKVVRFVDRTQNRACRFIMLNFLRARIRDGLGLRTFDTNRVKQLGGMPFIIAPPDGTEEVRISGIDDIVSMLVLYQKTLSEKNIRFVFMPMPCKENIYYRLGDSGDSSDYLDRLVAAAREAGVETVDLKQAFQKAVEEDENLRLYIADDSHWNKNGVEIAAELLIRYMGLDSAAEYRSVSGTPPENSLQKVWDVKPKKQ